MQNQKSRSWGSSLVAGEQNKPVPPVKNAVTAAICEQSRVSHLQNLKLKENQRMKKNNNKKNHSSGHTDRKAM